MVPGGEGDWESLFFKKDRRKEKKTRKMRISLIGRKEGKAVPWRNILKKGREEG